MYDSSCRISENVSEHILLLFKSISSFTSTEEAIHELVTNSIQNLGGGFNLFGSYIRINIVQSSLINNRKNYCKTWIRKHCFIWSVTSFHHPPNRLGESQVLHKELQALTPGILATQPVWGDIEGANRCRVAVRMDKRKLQANTAVSCSISESVKYINSITLLYVNTVEQHTVQNISKNILYISQNVLLPVLLVWKGI